MMGGNDTETGRDWQQHLALEPHPEGGWFRRIHTADATVASPRGMRAASSAIHYLLTAAEPRGRFHRVHSTILHFLQSGGPVQYRYIGADDEIRDTTLALDGSGGLFLEVPPGVWKASRLIGAADHALVSEVVVPGFDWADHEYLVADRLPAELVLRLSHEGWV